MICMNVLICLHAHVLGENGLSNQTYMRVRDANSFAAAFREFIGVRVTLETFSSYYNFGCEAYTQLLSPILQFVPLR